jgi:hypothetical protein
MVAVGYNSDWQTSVVEESLQKTSLGSVGHRLSHGARSTVCNSF